MKAIRFQGGRLNHIMSRGWMVDPPAFIHPRILFGSGMALTPEFARKHSITHVINCAFDEDSPTWFREKFPTRYKSLNAIDALEVNILDWYPEFEESMQNFSRDPNCKNVYVHCQCGINRSGFLCLNFMIKKLNQSFYDSMQAILYQRPCALTNSSFKEQIMQNAIPHID